MPIHRETTYERWIKEQGLPTVAGHGVESALDLPRASWPRLGGKGTFIKFQGMEGVTGMYTCEIAPGGALNPEKHLYEEIIYVLQGRGSTEVCNPGSEKKSFFEWQAGSLFAIPINTSHRMFNGSGSESAVFLGFTNAPLIFDVFHNPDFVLGDNYVFDDRFDGRADYFATSDNRTVEPLEKMCLWQTNFVPNVRGAILDSMDKKGAGVQLTQLEMGDGILVGHITEWPVGRYHKAHHHGAGAVLVIVKSVGFSLMWPEEYGIRPYEAGHADKVVKIDWREGSVFGPPAGWYHQHFDTGPEPARQLALRYGTRRVGVEFRDIQNKEGMFVSTRLGGTLIEYEDEDPEIRRLFAAECAKNGVEVSMPEFASAR